MADINFINYQFSKKATTKNQVVVVYIRTHCRNGAEKL